MPRAFRASPAPPAPQGAAGNAFTAPGIPGSGPSTAPGSIGGAPTPPSTGNGIIDCNWFLSLSLASSSIRAPSGLVPSDPVLPEFSHVTVTPRNACDSPGHRFPFSRSSPALAGGARNSAVTATAKRAVAKTTRARASRAERGLNPLGCRDPLTSFGVLHIRFIAFLFLNKVFIPVLRAALFSDHRLLWRFSSLLRTTIFPSRRLLRRFFSPRLRVSA